jgi:hypothetical protein
MDETYCKSCGRRAKISGLGVCNPCIKLKAFEESRKEEELAFAADSVIRRITGKSERLNSKVLKKRKLH